MLTVLHICPVGDWESVPEGRRYRPDSLDDVGFVHCSDRGTLHLPANRLYPGRTDLLVLEIDTSALDVPVRWEPGLPPETETMPWFPHVYGPIPRSAVVEVHELHPRADGTFRLPEALIAPLTSHYYV